MNTEVISSPAGIEHSIPWSQASREKIGKQIIIFFPSCLLRCECKEMQLQLEMKYCKNDVSEKKIRPIYFQSKLEEKLGNFMRAFVQFVLKM